MAAPTLKPQSQGTASGLSHHSRVHLQSPRLTLDSLPGLGVRDTPAPGAHAAPSHGMVPTALSRALPVTLEGCTQFHGMLPTSRAPRVPQLQPRPPLPPPTTPPCPCRVPQTGSTPPPSLCPDIPSHHHQPLCSPGRAPTTAGIPESPPAPALPLAAADPEPKPTRELWPGAAPLPRILRARRSAMSPRPGQPPVFSACPESSSLPEQGRLWAPGANDFAGGGGRVGGLPGPAVDAPTGTQQPQPGYKRKSLFFPGSASAASPGELCNRCPAGAFPSFPTQRCPPSRLPPARPSPANPMQQLPSGL